MEYKRENDRRLAAIEDKERAEVRLRLSFYLRFVINMLGLTPLHCIARLQQELVAFRQEKEAFHGFIREQIKRFQLVRTHNCLAFLTSRSGRSR